MSFEESLSFAIHRQNKQLIESVEQFHEYNKLLLAKAARLEKENINLRRWVRGLWVAALVLAVRDGLRRP